MIFMSGFFVFVFKYDMKNKLNDWSHTQNGENNDEKNGQYFSSEST